MERAHGDSDNGDTDMNGANQKRVLTHPGGVGKKKGANTISFKLQVIGNQGLLNHINYSCNCSHVEDACTLNIYYLH